MNPHLVITRIQTQPPGTLVYRCLRQPAVLFGMQRPPAHLNWQPFSDAGVRWLVDLGGERPAEPPVPLDWLHRVALTDLSYGGEPDDAGGEEGMIRRIADDIADRLRAGEGVVVYGVGGRGRTGCVLGVTLARLGFPPKEIVARLDDFHATRGQSWPESPWQAQLVRRTRPR